MTKQTRILLALSVLSFFVSITGALHGLFLPIGAILLGLFMISCMLEKEVAKFDEEQQLRQKSAERKIADRSHPASTPPPRDPPTNTRRQRTRGKDPAEYAEHSEKL